MTKNIGMLLLIGLLLSSCYTVNKGYISSNASLQAGNFKVKGIAIGKSQSHYFCCIGGNKNGLMLEAKKDMYQNANLLNNQTIANISCDNNYSFVFFPIYLKHQVVLSGDIIEFSDSANSSTDTIVKANIQVTTVSLYEFKVGDAIKFKDMWGIVYKGNVKSIQGSWYNVVTESGNEVVVKENDIVK